MSDVRLELRAAFPRPPVLLAGVPRRDDTGSASRASARAAQGRRAASVRAADRGTGGKQLRRGGAQVGRVGQRGEEVGSVVRVAVDEGGRLGNERPTAGVPVADGTLNACYAGRRRRCFVEMAPAGSTLLSVADRGDRHLIEG